MEPQIAAEGAKSPSFANCRSSGQEKEKHKNRVSGQGDSLMGIVISSFVARKAQSSPFDNSFSNNFSLF